MTQGYVYVHSGTLKEFQDYQTQNPQYNCAQILDGTTLRGRTPGLIIRIGTHRSKWNAQEIEESISTHELLWQENIQEQQVQTSVDDKNILDYGIGE